jgi:DNA-binding beta-propeller fold protein YncE
MRSSRLRTLVVISGVMIAAGSMTAPAEARTHSLSGRRGSSTALSTPGTQLWAKQFSAVNGANPTAIAVSPDASRVFVVGSASTVNGSDLAVIAYSADGTQLWSDLYNGPKGTGTDGAGGVVVSPNGSKVFVTGGSEGTTSGYDYVTLAYRASTGRRLWVRRYNGPGNATDEGTAINISPNGSRIFVTGISYGATSLADYATLAYRARKGALLWVSRYNGSANADDYGSNSLGVSPDGSKVFVTGSSMGAASGSDFATLAYSAATGQQLWVARYDGTASSQDGADALAVSPDGSKVFVTGQSAGTSTNLDYATVAYNAATGSEQWASRYDDGNGGGDIPYGVAVSPDGTKVAVTGVTAAATASTEDYATVVYDTTNGTTEWVAPYDGPGNGGDAASAVTISPDGTKVFVTGATTGLSGNSDYGTIAYDATSGTQVWSTAYDSSPSGGDLARALAVSPDGTKVFVTGQSNVQIATVAYAT